MRKYIEFILLSLLIILVVSSAASFPVFGAAGETGDPANLLGHQWLVLGPFPNPSGGDWEDCSGFSRDYLSAYGGEAAIRPKINQKTAGKIWRSYPGEQGTLDLTGPFGPIENSVAYAYQEFKCDRPGPLALKLGSDDGIKVWLNGRLIWERHIHRSLMRDDDALRVDVKAGTNRILIKVDQGNGGWGFSARFRSLQEETADLRAQRTRPAKLQIILAKRFLKTRESSRALTIPAVVATQPALAVSIPIELRLYDWRGKLLAEEKSQTGTTVNLALPNGYQNIARIQAVGNGPYSSMTNEAATFLAGDPEKISRTIVAWARRTAKRKPLSRGEDIAATLTFLCDQLEGRVDRSLVTIDRNIRAIETLNQIRESLAKNGNKPWQPGTLRGLRQWAYRSPIDGTCQPYSLYLPEDYDPGRKYKLVVSLHGYSGDDYNSATTLLEGVRPRDFIVAAPFGRGDLAYGTIGEQDVLDLMDLVMKVYPIDPNRVYLTGISMGGCGTWRIGQFYADRFAAIVPFCGWTGTDYLENLRNLSVLVVHGDADTSVPIESDENAVACLEDLGYKVRFEPLEGVDHNAWAGWVKKHHGNGLFDYLRDISRDPWPRQVILTTSYLRYRRLYWAGISELSGQGKGVLDARIIDTRHVRVETENLTVFSLDLHHPALTQNGRILVDIDGYAVPADAGSRAEFVYSPTRNCFVWQPERRSGLASHQGGGLADLVTDPIFIVYGTRKPGRVEILKKSAAILADWSTGPVVSFGTKVGRFRVKPDTAVTKADLRGANLILLGTVAENRLTAKYAAAKQMPVKFDSKTVTVQGKKYPGAGFILVYPNPEASGRLLGILSLPFNTKTLEQFMVSLNLSLRQYAPGNGVGSFTTPDLMVLKSPGELLWSGSFDRNWRFRP